MDTVTHMLLGALTVRALYPAKHQHSQLSNGSRMSVCAVAAAFPDIDYLAFWINPLTFLAVWHRGPTHSLIMLPFWALLLGTLLWIAFRRRADWQRFVGLCALGLISHIAFDLVTVYGTQLFAPLSNYRVAIGISFDVDLWLAVAAGLGVFVAMASRSSWPVYLSVAVVLSYLGTQAVLHDKAVALAQGYITQHRLDGAEAHALPQPLSPFNWKLIVSGDDEYHIAHVNLAGGYDDRTLWGVLYHYQASDRLSWRQEHQYGNEKLYRNRAKQLWWHDELAAFRHFAKLPMLYRVDNHNPDTCLWYTDLRYVLPFATPPFRYGMCRRHSADRWRLYRLRRFAENDRQLLSDRPGLY